MNERDNEAKRAEAASYLFTEAVELLEKTGWKRDKTSTSNPWYWWRNPEVATGTCSLGAALRYEHARQEASTQWVQRTWEHENLQRTVREIDN